MTQHNLPYLIVFCMAMALGPAAEAAMGQPAFTDSTFQRLDAYIESKQQELGIPGTALAVVADGKIMYQKGYGIAGPGNRPMTPETPMIIGSLSKSFTALAVMQLVEDGLVDLDDTISSYFPEAQTDSDITVRHLLTHTSRYSLADGRELFGIQNTSPSALSSRAATLLARAPESADMGSKFEYSNSNYQLLGAIIQKVSGKEYESYMEQEVLAPLHMDRSFTAFPEAQKNGMATGYRYIFGIPVPNEDLKYNRTITPSGYLVSTASDMGNYLIAMLNRGSFDSTEILSGQSVEQMFTPHKDLNYGFGWFIGQADGTKLVGHDGATEDFSARIWLYPSENWGVVILSNTMTYVSGPHMGEFRYGMREILTGGEGAEVGKAPYNFALNILLALFALQLLGALHGGWVIRRWKKDEDRVPDATPGRRLWHVWLPLGMSIVMIVIYLYLLPTQFSMTLTGMLAFAPDVTYLAIAGSILALLWGAYRTFAYRKLLMKQGDGIPVPADPESL